MRQSALFCVLALLLFACADRDSTALPQAAGAVNSLSVVIPDQLWDGEIGDSIRKKFAAPVDGLPQEEPQFTINQYPLRALDGRLTARNVLIIKKEDRSEYKMVRNEFAEPQHVAHISGKSIPDIITVLDEHVNGIVSQFKANEIAYSQRKIDTSKLESDVLKKRFKIDLLISNKYKVALSKRNFIWFKREILSGNTSLVVYRVPTSAIFKGGNVAGNIIRVRDSISGKYIRGKERGSKMQTEESYAPYFAVGRLNGRRIYETKGTWELKGDFMNGSFINFAIRDKKRNQFVIVEGFCYAPSTEKRDLMHELEAMIKSVKLY